MADLTFELLILYNNNECERHQVKNVYGYGYISEGDLFWFEKNGHRSFVPRNNVKFFGRKFDYDND